MSKLPESVVNNGRVSIGGLFYNKKLEIYIWDNDKIKEPHFHILDKETLGQKFHCRILLKKAKYVEGEDCKLSKRQIKSLIECFKRIDSATKPMNMNCWTLTVWHWNRNNKNKAWYKRMPDYTKLE